MYKYRVMAMVNSFTTVAGMELYWTIYKVKYSIYLYSESNCFNIPGNICHKIKNVKQQQLCSLFIIKSTLTTTYDTCMSTNIKKCLSCAKQIMLNVVLHDQTFLTSLVDPAPGRQNVNLGIIKALNTDSRQRIVNTVRRRWSVFNEAPNRITVLIIFLMAVIVWDGVLIPYQVARLNLFQEGLFC